MKNGLEIWCKRVPKAMIDNLKSKCADENVQVNSRVLDMAFGRAVKKARTLKGKIY